jgi:RNA recognition motif-containing protein
MRHRSRDKEIASIRDDIRESSDYYRPRNDIDNRKRARSPVSSSYASISRLNTQQLLRTKVFVGNIHDSVTSTDLRKLFEPYGHIVECNKIPTKDYAFVVSLFESNFQTE